MAEYASIQISNTIAFFLRTYCFNKWLFSIPNKKRQFWNNFTIKSIKNWSDSFYQPCFIQFSYQCEVAQLFVLPVFVYLFRICQIISIEKVHVLFNQLRNLINKFAENKKKKQNQSEMDARRHNAYCWTNSIEMKWLVTLARGPWFVYQNNVHNMCIERYYLHIHFRWNTGFSVATVRVFFFSSSRY